MSLAQSRVETRSQFPQTLKLADPAPSLLADLLASRMAAEEKPLQEQDLPFGVSLNLRPKLPPVSRGALMLHMNHKAVDSYPLIFTTLALAHPN